MKLSTLIHEDKETEHRKELSEGKFLEYLKERAKNSHVVATKSPFFRQDKGPDMMLVTPEHKEERSAFWIDKIIKEIPAWNKFPSRSRFIKGYTQFSRTYGGDDVYVLIPFDGTKIGIAPKNSFYHSFTDIEKSLGFDRVDNKTFADWVRTLQDAMSKITDFKAEKNDPVTYSQFKKYLTQIDKALGNDRVLLKKQMSESDKLTDDQAKMLKDMLSRHIVNMELYLAEKLEPEINGFETVRIESFSKASGDHEIWVDQPCLLIKRTKYIEMHKRGAF